MGPFGMPGASVPGPPGSKVCMHSWEYFFLLLGPLVLEVAGGGEFMIPVNENFSFGRIIRYLVQP